MTIISPLYEQNPPPNESITVIVRKKKKSSTNFVSLRCNRHHFNISSLSFLPCHLFHFFIQWIFGPNHCQWFHFSIKLGDAVSLFCQLKAFFLSHGQWRCHRYYLVFSKFVTFFSLPPSFPQSPPSQDKIAFPRSAVHFFVLSLFFPAGTKPLAELSTKTLLNTGINWNASSTYLISEIQWLLMFQLFKSFRMSIVYLQSLFFI